MVIFRNYQWGAEKRNTTLWYDNNFVGTELDRDTSYAGIARACGLEGVVVRSPDELTHALHEAVERMRGRRPNLPWPLGVRHEQREEPPREYLLLIPVDSPGGRALATMLGPDGDTVIHDEQLDRLPSETLESAY